jgi:polyphosphate glucokinase
MDEVTTLVVDVGGTDLKLQCLAPAGAPRSAPTRTPTPRPAGPAPVIDAVVAAAAHHGAFDRVAVGFPGVVVDGVTLTAPNLDPTWAGVDLGGALAARLGAPVRVANDADLQGFAWIEGRGVELALTLGTGLGAGLYVDGRLVPNLELGHHPWRDGATYEELLGKAALAAVGPAVWSDRLRDALALLAAIFNFRRCALGGGHARLIEGPLPARVVVADNLAGLAGGLRLWAP